MSGSYQIANLTTEDLELGFWYGFQVREGGGRKFTQQNLKKSRATLKGE